MKTRPEPALSHGDLITRCSALRSALNDLAADCENVRALPPAVHLRQASSVLDDLILEVTHYSQGKQGLWHHE